MHWRIDKLEVKPYVGTVYAQVWDYEGEIGDSTAMRLPKAPSEQDDRSAALSQWREIVLLGLPNCLEKMSSFLPGFVLMLLLGKLGPDAIAGYGMGCMFANGILKITFVV